MLFPEAPMPYLSFADLIRHRVPLSAREAVALTLAVARVLDARRGPGDALRLPGDHEILLNNTGDVTFGGVSPSTEQEEIVALASLLRRLLQLDMPDRDRRGRVPGGLLVLLARALQQIDLEAPRRDEFTAALVRFAGGSPADAATLAVIFWRAGGLRPALVPKVTPLALLPPARVEEPRERRLNGPTRADLRRALRDLERQMYEREQATPVRRRDRHPAVAAAIIGAMLAAMLAGGLLRPAPDGVLSRGPDPTAAPAFEHDAATREVVAPPAAGPAPFAVSSLRSVPLVTRAALGRDAFSPSFDPTGQTLYFHAGRTAAPLMRASVAPNGSIAGITKLLDDGWSNYHVTMSPDGRMLAFDSDRDGLRGVYIADAEGRHPRRVSGSGYAAVPSWSPDGRRLAFVRGEPSQASVWNVWVADVAGGTLRRVTQHRAGQAWGASWFPDGRRVAYSHETQLVIADLETGRSTVIASPRPGHLVRTPAVSPDGSRVVFQVHGDGAWMLDVERMRLRRVLPDPSAEEFVWSPNGRSVAFHARTNEGWGVWRMDL
jgi:Tol biopolymer transport system component